LLSGIAAEEGSVEEATFFNFFSRGGAPLGLKGGLGMMPTVSKVEKDLGVALTASSWITY